MLHGVYERPISGGYRAAIVNNGSVLHRYDYLATRVRALPDRRLSFSNLVHTLGFWQVGQDALRPVTQFPASEFPQALRRTLWNEPILLDSVTVGSKTAATLSGTLREVTAWTADAASSGLLVRPARSWVDAMGVPRGNVLISRPGPIASAAELSALQAEYERQLPGYPITGALDKIGGLTGEELSFRELVSPQTENDLIVTDFCFGYPPATTAACVTGTHG